MRKYVRGNIGNAFFRFIIRAINKTRKLLTIIGIIGLLWSYVPWNEIKAVVIDEVPVIEEILLDESQVNGATESLPEYPTTTDQDFDPSQVAIENEVNSERTATSKTFRKIDGTYEVAMYNAVVHYYENGEYKQVNNSLFDNGSSEYENKDNIFKVKFPKTIDDNKQIKLSLDKYSVDWNVLNINSSDISFDDTEITPNNIKELVNINQSILYSNVQPNVDIEYMLTGSKIKENVILSSYIPDFSISFEYKIKDLELVTDEDGNVLFVNEDGETIFTFDSLFMIDSDNNESSDIAFNYIETGNKEYLISITPNDEWMQSAIYPVNIDPSVTLMTNNIDLRDKYVYSTSGQNSTANYIKSGYSGSYKYRSYIEVAIDSLPTDAVVNYAHLNLNLYSNYCVSDCQVNVRMVNQTTSFNSIAGQYLTDVDSRIVDYKFVKLTDGTSVNYIFDVSRAIKLWKNDGASVGVLELRNKDESVSDYVYFDSLEYSTTTGPRISIGYVETTGLKDYWTYSNQNAGIAGTGYVSDYTGKLTIIRNDFSFNTEKQSLGLSMIYNIDNKDINIGYGFGWQTNYNMKMIYDVALNANYTIDATGNKVYYYLDVCDDRVETGGAFTNVCYLAEDGSSNMYVREYEDSDFSNAYILTNGQIKFNFGTDSYLDSIYDVKNTLETYITRDSNNKDHITFVSDDSDNEIYFHYSLNMLDYTILSTKQYNIQDNIIIEKVKYFYTTGDYDLSYVEYYKNYDETLELTIVETAHYVSDSSARITQALVTGKEQVIYTYNTNNNKIININSYFNGYHFSEVDYIYEFQNTKITNHNDDFINYYFDNYGHTVNVRDSYGNSRFYSYINLFNNQIQDGYGGIIDIILTDGIPNYRNNHKLINSSDPIKTQFNPVNNSGFEYDNIYMETKWNYIDDLGYLQELDRCLSNDMSVFGDYSAKINSSLTNNGHFNQTIILDQGTYTVSGYVMNSTNSSTQAYITVDGEYWQGSITNVPNDGEWHYVSLQFGVSGSDQEIDVQLFNHGVGKAYFDSIQVLEGFQDTRKNIIDNPSMEIVDSSGDLPGWTFSNPTYVNRVDHSSYVSGIETEILGDYSIEIDGSSTENRYAQTYLHGYLDLPYTGGSLVIGSWAKSEGTPTSQMATTINTLSDIDRIFRIGITVKDYNLNLLSTHYIDFDPSIEGWQYVLEEVNIPEDGIYVDLYFEYQGEGTVNFDGLQVYFERMNTDYGYDEYGHVVKLTSPSGDVTDFEYDNAFDNRATSTSNGESEIQLQINDENALISEVNFNNVVADPTYNSDGLVTQLTIGDTSSDYFTTSTSYLSTGFGQYKSTSTDEFNKVTTYYHDTVTGLLKAIENAKGEDLYYIYDNEGKLVKAISLTNYTNPTNNIHGIVEYEYNSNDRLSKIIIDENYYYELIYDSQGRMAQVKVNSQSLMNYSYEMDDTIYTNRLSTQTYGNGDEMKFIYNDENQIVEVQFKDYDGSFETRFGYDYDQSGKLAVFKTYLDGELDKSEFYTYDSSGNLILVTDDEGNEIKYIYDESGNVTSLYFKVDEAEGNTNYFYNHCFAIDGNNECIEKSNLYDYTEYTSQSDVDVTKEYHHESSALYRLDYINLITGTTSLYKQDFVYSGDTTRLYEITYDILNNDSVDYTYRYSYDELGNIESIYYYEGMSLETYEHYEYDELNQLHIENMRDYSVVESNWQPDNYTKYFYYDNHGNITDIKTFLYGEEDTYLPVAPNEYRTNLGTIDIFVSVSGDETISVGDSLSLSYTYYLANESQVPVPMITLCDYSTVDTSTAGYYLLECQGKAKFGTTYILDFGLLITVGTPIGGYTTPQEHIHYNYDNTWLDQMTGYGTIDYINAVPQTEVAVQNYTYDSQGNPTTITQFYYDEQYYNHANLEYDGRQLTKIIVYSDLAENNEIVTISYTYNDQGYRTSKTIDDGTIQTILHTLIDDKVIYETDGLYGIVYSYDYDGTIISYHYDDGVTYDAEIFYVKNQQGDITKLINKDGIILVEYIYDAWGNILETEYNSSYQSEAERAHLYNRYFYRGYRYDDEVNLYYLNSRFYNPVFGRFINADGLLGEQGNILGHNMYSYTQNNPVMYTDYSGRAPECWNRTKDWVSSQKRKMLHRMVDTFIKVSNISHDLREIFHENSTALIYNNGGGLGGTLLDTGLYYSEGFEGYYIDGHNKHRIINGQRIDLVIFSYTAVQLEDGSWTGSAGPSLGPISFENYGPEWYQWSLYATVGVEGGLGYSTGTSYTVDVIGYIEDVWQYFFKED